ncbi:MAG: DUF5011 domain-containing protein, partial [Clostridia bacterium]|nr:DUF5011 domain-containing protein [Clostridia bacterium]
SEYLIYTAKDEKINFNDYIVDAVDSDENSLKSKVTVESTADFKTPGTYHVHYYVTDSRGLRGHSVLTVIVEE